MALINVPDIQNLDPATPELFNSRFGTIADEINGNLDAANLEDSAVTAPKLASDSVTTGKIVDAAVTPPKWANPYKFSVYRSAAQNAGNGALAVIQFDTESFDSSNMVDTTTNKGRFTAPISGFYWLFAQANITDAPSSFALIALLKNGTEVKRGVQYYNSGSSSPSIGASVGALLQLAAGDYIEAAAQTAGTNPLQPGAVYTYFDGYLVSIT